MGAAMPNKKDELELIIKKVIKRVLEEQEKKEVKEKNTYIVFNEVWDNRYYFLFEELNKIKDKNVYAVLLNEDCNVYKNKIEKLYTFTKVMKLEEFLCEEEDVIIFPVMKRDEVIHIASCLSDTKTTELIKKCFENGVKIYILKYGIEKLTGKEPEKYKQKILNYYKEIFEFDIEIIENLKVVM